MNSYSKNDVILVRYPFTDLSATKVRPAIVVHAPHPSMDLIIVPLTSRCTGLQNGEFVLTDWLAVGLNVESAVKRGIFTIHPQLVVKSVGNLQQTDIMRVNDSLRLWLGL